MGSWQLEVAKMFFYVMFPVATFHVFNQPDIFEEWVTKTKAEIYPKSVEENVKKYKQMKLEYQKKMREEKGESELLA